MIYEKFDYLFEEYNKGVVEIKEIYIDIYKTKPLNGSSYIALPEYITNKKAVINIKMKITIALFIRSYVVI